MTHPRPFEQFVAPARARPQLWRLIAGLVVVVAVYALWMALMGLGLWLTTASGTFDMRLAEVGTGSDPVSLIVLLLTFAGMALGVFAAVRWLHGRPAGSVFGRAPVVLRDFLAGLVVLGGLGLVGLLTMPLAHDLQPGLDLRLWLMFLPLALVGLLIQTGAEELVFRGYMQQQLAARFRSALVWMVLPSILFGLVHYAPSEMGDNSWFVVLATGAFGLAAADLTARSGSLGLAWGLHFANNVFAVLFFTAGDVLDGMALYRLPFGPDDLDDMRPLIVADIAVIAFAWFLCRLWLRSR